MKKNIWVSGSLLVAVIAIAAYLFFFNIDGILQSSIQKYIADATQTSVDIKSVDMSLRTGEGIVKDFRLSNPKSFLPRRAIKVESIDFQVDQDTITGDQPIIIDVLNINTPIITYAVGNDYISNWNVIDQNLHRPLSAPTPSRKMIIKDLYIRDGTVVVTHPLLRLRQVPAPLPAIHLNNVGKANGTGVSQEEITRLVLSEISKRSSAVGEAVLKKEIKPSNPFPMPLFRKESKSQKNADKGLMER